MKQTKQLVFAAILGMLVFTSCKKETVVTQETPSITGYWKGKYGNGTDYPSRVYTFLYRSNGTVRIYDGSDSATAGKAEGTYAISGNVVTSTYNYLSGGQFSTTATVDSKFTFLEGTWGPGTIPFGGGLYFVNKQ